MSKFADKNAWNYFSRPDSKKQMKNISMDLNIILKN